MNAAAQTTVFRKRPFVEIRRRPFLPPARLLVIVFAALLVLPPISRNVFAQSLAAFESDSQEDFLISELPSEFQAGPTQVRVLLPAPLDTGRRYPVLYILPVVGQGSNEFGDGLEEARKADVANRFGVICVAPSFTTVPWYGDHASDPQIRQESFILHSLLPFIDRNLPTQTDPDGRWLIGFSKSGWGAYTLLLRHPDVFGYAAAWDVPFMLDGDNSGADWGPMGIKRVFGSKEGFQQSLPTRLVADNAEFLKLQTRLVLGVGKHWKPQVTKFHALLESLGIPHIYRSDLVFKHRWDTGWFAPIVDDLVKIARAPRTDEPPPSHRE